MPPAILITGGARRIGAVLTRAFAAAGWHVVIHYGNSREDAEALAAELPSAEIVACELSDPKACDAMVTDLAARLPDWRVLANNAAIFREDRATALDPAIFAQSMAINAEAPVRLAQAFLRAAKAKGGRRVIQFTDMKVANPNPDFLSYTLSKQALAASVKLLAMAQSDQTDRVYGIAPGAMLASHDQRDEEHEISGRLNLLNRLTGAEELAKAALFLAEGWLASGETLFVDSGQHLLAQPRDVLYLARGMS